MSEPPPLPGKKSRLLLRDYAKYRLVYESTYVSLSSSGSTGSPECARMYVVHTYTRDAVKRFRLGRFNSPCGRSNSPSKKKIHSKLVKESVDVVSGWAGGEKEKENYPVTRRYADELSFEEKELRRRVRKGGSARKHSQTHERKGFRCDVRVTTGGAILPCREAFRKFASQRRRKRKREKDKERER